MQIFLQTSAIRQFDITANIIIILCIIYRKNNNSEFYVNDPIVLLAKKEIFTKLPFFFRTESGIRRFFAEFVWNSKSYAKISAN